LSIARLEGRLVRFMLDTSKEVREDNLPSCDGRLLVLRPDRERRSSDRKPHNCEGNDEIIGFLSRSKILRECRSPISVGRAVNKFLSMLK